MKEGRLGQTDSKGMKKTEVHPLCSRKRALSKIIASPTYQERLKKENNPPKKKKKEVGAPKFEYLQRRKRYGDDLRKKKKSNSSSELKKSQSPCLQTASIEQSKRDEAIDMKTPRVEKKEYIHPLCSRQRSLAKIVESPSYKLPKLPQKNINSLYKISPCVSSKLSPTKSAHFSSKVPQRTPALKRRYTIMPSLQNEENKENVCNVSDLASPAYTSTIRKSHAKDRRLTTFAKWKPHDEEESFLGVNRGLLPNVINSTEKEMHVMTPWRNKEMGMRERLDLWLAAKNKTPTPYKPKFKKSPHPNRKSKTFANLRILTEENSNEFLEESPVCVSSEENGAVISKELEAIVRKFENQVEREEIERNLDDMIRRYTTIVKFADYWICKARLASLDDDVQRVICLLEQAHTFQAQPGDKIKEEICRYLELLESREKKDGNQRKQVEEDRERLVSLYAITPGRRVHFAAAESPLDFKSSVIRFCLLESKAFKRRLNAQLKRKVLTPVRRSLRVEKSELPEFLRTDNRVVGSPGEVEGDIIDGEISFVPNKSLNTPLNKGWLIQDETNTETTSNKIGDDAKADSVEELRNINPLEIELDECTSAQVEETNCIDDETSTHEIHGEVDASGDDLEEIELSFM